MKKNKSRKITVLLFIILFVGLSLLLYPTVSDYWNSLHQSRAIANYSENVTKVSQEVYDTYIEEAIEYNSTLIDNPERYKMTDEQREQYNSLLNITGTGIIGYIEIESIKCSLPIYHGTSDSVLQMAIGHIEGTSLPVGGVGTHCVLSGHRGLPSARLFTDLDKLKTGDTFVIRVLNETLTYEVDQILIVKPYELDALNIDPEMDYCTLVTCTPYGINTHRMLVRGHRVENQEQALAIKVTSDAMLIDPIITAPILSIPLLLMLLVVLMIPTHKKNTGVDSDDEKH